MPIPAAAARHTATIITTFPESASASSAEWVGCFVPSVEGWLDETVGSAGFPVACVPVCSVGWEVWVGVVVITDGDGSVGFVVGLGSVGLVVGLGSVGFVVGTGSVGLVVGFGSVGFVVGTGSVGLVVGAGSEGSVGVGWAFAFPVKVT